MKRLITLATSGVAVVTVALLVAAMQVDRPAPQPVPDDVMQTAFTLDDAEFIGATKCRTCHRKPEAGEQYPKWEESAHARAFQTLGTEEAKTIAAEMGIDDPQAADACLKCHVTGHGVAAERLGDKYSIDEGVTCEACHGAGGNYYKKKTMESITSGEIEGASVGLVTPTEETCTGCHNEESPTFKGFDFEASSAEIAHPIPEETRAQYK